MKPQDILFILVFVGFLFIRKERIMVALGVICLATSIPLYMSWVFFTAQRLVMYGVAFIFMSLVFSLFRKSTLQ